MRISTKARGLSFAAASVLALAAHAGILYNPVVTMVGDGSAASSGQGKTTTIRIYANTTANQSSPLSQLAYNSGATGTRLVNTNGTTEGLLSNNPGLVDAAAAGLSYSGNAYVFSAGYDAANNTASVIMSAANANRAVGYMSVNNSTASGATIAVTQTQGTAYNDNDIRSAVGDDNVSSFWTGGNADTASTSGWRYFSTNTRLVTSDTNVRSVEIHGGRLFGSTATGTHGLYVIGTGTPTAATTDTNIINTGSGNSDEFVLIDDPNNHADTTSTFGYDTAYIADDSAKASGGGIQKWTWNGTSWSLAYTLNDGTSGNRGLAGQLDPDTGDVVLWATTSAQNKLEQVTDTGAGSTFITLATAPSNDVFQGVALAPVPEPTCLGIAALLLPILAARRRRD